MKRKELETFERDILPARGHVSISVATLRRIIAAAKAGDDAYERGRSDQLEECRQALAEALGVQGSWSAMIVVTEVQRNRLNKIREKELA